MCVFMSAPNISKNKKIEQTSCIFWEEHKVRGG